MNETMYKDASAKLNQADADFAQADAALASLLSRGFLRPVADFVATLRDGSYASQFSHVLNSANDETIAEALAAISDLGAELAAMEPEEARLTLEVDYNRLFVGPGKLLAPPYESFYRSEPDEEGRGTICGLPMLAVKEFYKRFGCEMPEGFVDYPDHIAFEMEFLSLLAKEEARCLREGDTEGAAAFQKGAAEFRNKHLGVWVQTFASNVEAGAETSLYPALASLLVKTQL